MRYQISFATAAAAVAMTLVTVGGFAAAAPINTDAAAHPLVVIRDITASLGTDTMLELSAAAYVEKRANVNAIEGTTFQLEERSQLAKRSHEGKAKAKAKKAVAKIKGKAKGKANNTKGSCSGPASCSGSVETKQQYDQTQKGVNQSENKDPKWVKKAKANVGKKCKDGKVTQYGEYCDKKLGQPDSIEPPGTSSGSGSSKAGSALKGIAKGIKALF